jgi:hypothetical protein
MVQRQEPMLTEVNRNKEFFKQKVSKLAKKSKPGAIPNSLVNTFNRSFRVNPLECPVPRPQVDSLCDLCARL